MNTSIERLPDNVVRIAVDMVPEDYAKEVRKTLNDYRKRFNMPGFRVGNAPMALIEKRFGTQARIDVVNNKMGEAVAAAIEENKLRFLGEPLAPEGRENAEPQDLEKDGNFHFEVEVGLMPELSLTLTSDDKVTKYVIGVADDDVEKQVKQICESNGDLADVDSYEGGTDSLRGNLVEVAEDKGEGESIAKDNVMLMPTYFKNDDQRQLFNGAKVGDVVTFCLATAYEDNEADAASLLGIKKEELAAHRGNFTYTVTEVKRFVPATPGQELYNRLFPNGTVTTEEEFRAKVKEEMASQMEGEADRRFVVDLMDYLREKTGEMNFPKGFIRRLLLKKSKENITEENIDETLENQLKALRDDLIARTVGEQLGVNVTESNIDEEAHLYAAHMFRQYDSFPGLENYMQSFAHNMLQNEGQRNMLEEMSRRKQIAQKAQSVVTLDRKEISIEEFKALS